MTNAKIISFISTKDSVGKTTLTIHDAFIYVTVKLVNFSL